MSENEILTGIKTYFKITEFVGTATFKKYGDRSWRFLDFRLLETLLIIRETLNRPIRINHGTSEQRGLRTNIQPMVKGKLGLYLSAHILGKAIDFDVKGMEAQEVRDWIVANESIFPYKIRLEDGVSWVHLDVIYESHNPKVYLFKP